MKFDPVILSTSIFGQTNQHIIGDIAVGIGMTVRFTLNNGIYVIAVDNNTTIVNSVRNTILCFTKSEQSKLLNAPPGAEVISSRPWLMVELNGYSELKIWWNHF